MKCPKCSETIPANSNRCFYCGYVVTEEDRDAYINEMIKNPVETSEVPDFENDYEPIAIPRGSYFLGFVLGMLLNIIGVIIAIATRGRRTKFGSGIGFIFGTALILIGLGVYFLIDYFVKIEIWVE